MTSRVRRFASGAILGFTAVIGLSLAISAILPTPSKVVNKEFIACMSHGCTYCNYMEEKPCGISLSKCVDTREYFCLHDVSFKLTPE